MRRPLQTNCKKKKTKNRRTCVVFDLGANTGYGGSNLQQRLRRNAQTQLHLFDFGAQIGERLLDETQRRRVGDALSVRGAVIERDETTVVGSKPKQVRNEI
jgi:hypothetical protein